MLNVAVTLCAEFIVTVQVPVPLHAPLHPANVLPLPGVAVSVTCVPLLKFALHVLGQLIPLGALTTLPVPVPASVTVSGKPDAVNVTVTFWFCVMENVHVDPPQSRLQLANVLPLAGASVNVTVVPLG